MLAESDSVDESLSILATQELSHTAAPIMPARASQFPKNLELEQLSGISKLLSGKYFR